MLGLEHACNTLELYIRVAMESLLAGNDWDNVTTRSTRGPKRL